MSRITRHMFCLMEGRHVHPSTLYPGGTGTMGTSQIFTDYLTRLMEFMDFAKKAVPLYDDLMDFFYEALPGYEEVGNRRVLLGCWGSFQDPDVVDYKYENMQTWGDAMYVTPGIVVDGELVTTNLVDINLGIRILLGSSYYEDWENEETFVTHDPLGNPVDKRHPWNQTTIPKPQKRDLNGGNYSWVQSPRWYDERTGDYLALDTGGGPIARLWATALAKLVDIGYVRAATGNSVEIYLPRSVGGPETRFEWKIPQYNNTLERTRARVYFMAYSAACAAYFVEKALDCVRAGDVQTFQECDRLWVPRGGARGPVAPHGDPGRQDRQLPPIPAHPLEREPQRLLRYSRSLRGRGAGPPDLRGERPRRLQRHRHHAHRAQLRSVPALWSAHVLGQGQDTREATLPDAGDRRRVELRKF
jgi:hydrogenase large subunit